MQVIVKGLASGYEAENLVRIFYPEARPKSTGGTKGEVAYVRVQKGRLAAALRIGGRVFVCTGCLVPGADAKLALCRMLYGLLQQATGLRTPWGMLTGVRPVRLLAKTAASMGEEEARRYLVGVYGISPEKLDLIQGIARLQKPILQAQHPKDYSLYISIPFCPSRCNYCSFVSRTTQKDSALLWPYVQKLQQELALTAEVARLCGLRLKTIYIGGGTPTALTAPQLEALLQSVQALFPVGQAQEYTVEAGRPDCTTPEKLALLKEYGATRISINPQTLNDNVLRAIGRRHTAQDIVDCFETARGLGHGNINMDLIAGLPLDTEESFANSLRGVLALKPENITVHALTLKRASNFVIENTAPNAKPQQMLAGAYPALNGRGYSPYYLYRQKNTLQNMENTGWALPGREGIYNIAIMEEIHTILAVGAGASTKLVGPGQTAIKRIYNHKYPAEYIENFEEILKRKQGVRDFYASNLDTETVG